MPGALCLGCVHPLLPLRLERDKKARVTHARCMQHALQRAGREQRAQGLSISAVARHDCYTHSDRCELLLEALPIAPHAATPRREQHARRAALDEQRRTAQPEAFISASELRKIYKQFKGKGGLVDTNRVLNGHLDLMAGLTTRACESFTSSALEKLSHVSMRCGGCGAKVGATVLSRVMERIREQGHVHGGPDGAVLLGLDAPDDCAVLAPSKLASVHTVDFFRSLIDDPFVFGQVAANHALSDCHAMNAQPHHRLAEDISPLCKLVESTPRLDDYPHAAEIIERVLVYDASTLTKAHAGLAPEERLEVEQELARALPLLG